MIVIVFTAAPCDQWTRHDLGREIERQLGVPVAQ